MPGLVGSGLRSGIYGCEESEDVAGGVAEFGFPVHALDDRCLGFDDFPAVLGGGLAGFIEPDRLLKIKTAGICR